MSVSSYSVTCAACKQTASLPNYGQSVQVRHICDSSPAFTWHEVALVLPPSSDAKVPTTPAAEPLANGEDAP